MVKLGLTFLLAILGGILGRMGGSGNYDRKWRIIGCSFLTLAVIFLFIGINLKLWYIYLFVFGLSCASLSTYWDFLFGFDNFWFSGFMCGVSLLPMYVGISVPMILLRSVILAIAWGLIHLYLPQKKFIIWDRAVAEEFLRYFVTILTIPLTLLGT